MTSDPKSSTPPPEALPPLDESDPLIGALRQQGLPLTKAMYLHLMFANEPPEFPLDAEILSEIPKGLDGEVPTDLTEFFAALP